MKKKFSSVENDQLYNLFLKCNKYINDTDDKGIIVGYAVIDALLNTSSDLGSDEEKKFNEVKSVYKTLNSVLLDLMKNETSYVLSDLQYRVEKKLQSKIAIESEIMTEFIPTLTKKKNPINYIKNTGLKLCENIDFKGQHHGTKNILLSDYETIKNTYR
jgi:hypothetical protein